MRCVACKRKVPELPEVETVRRDLAAHILGRRIERVEIDGARTVRRQSPDRVIEEVRDRKVEALRRHGKFLFIDIEGKQTLVAHLRMSGQLLWRSPDAPVVLHTHAQLVFENGERVDFVDPRTFGELWVTTPDVPELWHMGPDAFLERDKWDLRNRMRNRRGNLKALLLNQQFIAGIGNIYADEILWTSRLRADRVPSELSAQAVAKLEVAIAEIIADAVEHRGSTLRDARYTDLFGEAGSYASRHHVYGREGQPCDRCATPIRREAFANRSSHFCPRCQR